MLPICYKYHQKQETTWNNFVWILRQGAVQRSSPKWMRSFETVKDLRHSQVEQVHNRIRRRKRKKHMMSIRIMISYEYRLPQMFIINIQNLSQYHNIIILSWTTSTVKNYNPSEYHETPSTKVACCPVDESCWASLSHHKGLQISRPWQEREVSRVSRVFWNTGDDDSSWCVYMWICIYIYIYILHIQYHCINIILYSYNQFIIYTLITLYIIS